MILAFDTYYFDQKAKTVCLEFSQWNEDKNFKVYTEIIENVEEYIPGEFYKRELPCIVSLLNKIDLSTIDVIVVDGFVYLNDDQKFGLGGYLYEKLNKHIPIIGVAKTNFASIENNKKAIFRGDSKKPLYITSIGIDLEEAYKKVESMHGDFRMPTLLKELDRLTKENV
ncbi:exodeoxyribonuclease-5/deoxyribonuclease V [Flavobacterium nitrogenifigens]|uniref:Exodeoxyribonuclease-5/deoxyribonuclease V n=2 Tax=Flavobacterium TaxID=237 RepID=A0A7W7J0F2_9FLAO|nr:MULTISPECIES: endonuclease V [Flavobacterium]MBB4803951.1 exodeoxyribonuclease-5/deoxyribonuclease V [Flavobacterium nitrogenifigens]MBB6388897.1 exodeoxyribonuclease-5/deoxyribonuclease V [Flavobacterium notoginsengisoli]